MQLNCGIYVLSSVITVSQVGILHHDMATNGDVIKRTKKPNWDTKSVRALVLALEDHENVIRSKFGKSVTKTEKFRAWGEVETRVNSVSKVERTLEEIKKMWSDLSSQVEKKEATRRQEARKTGGGIQGEDLDELELKVVALLGEAAKGVTGGVDTVLDEEATIGQTAPESPLPCVPKPSTSSQLPEEVTTSTLISRTVRQNQKEQPSTLEALEELEREDWK